MNISASPNEYRKENFGLVLIAIALSALYLMISRCSLALTFFKIFLTLDSESKIKGYFIISLISFAVTMALSISFIFYFFKRKANAKFIFLSLTLMYLLFSLASYIYGQFVVGLDVNSIVPNYIDNLFIDTVIFLFVFTPYILFSNKSKMVFVRS